MAEPGPRGDSRAPPAFGAAPGPQHRAPQAEAAAQQEDAGSDWSEDSWSDYGSRGKVGTALGRTVPGGNVLFPDIFHTDHLFFYERFRTYQDYILADCKASEVKQFIAEYLEKVLEPSGWQAIWRTDVFEVVVGVVDVDYSSLKAVVELSEPFLCESRDSSFTLECMQELLELKEYQILLQELWVVFDESGEFDQTALAIEHVRFFYRCIWRTWDEEEEDDFDYFVRCVEPRLRLHYDILEHRVPSGLVADYQSLLSQCEELYEKFLNVRNSISTSDSDSEVENVSMVEGLKLYEKVEHLKQKLKLIENPLLRYVFGYQKYGSLQAKGQRAMGAKVTHVVSLTMMTSLLRLLMRDKFCPESCEDVEIQFHSDPLAAVNACYEGDTVIICPGHYVVDGVFCIADSIELEGYGLPDDIVIEKQGKGDNFFDCTGANVRISGLKLVQHDAVEGILNVHHGKTTLENCVLQCETTGITVRMSAELFMKNSDLYGAKGAGVEIYPGSTCTLLHNGIHHCKEGILIKNFLDEDYDVPKITMVNNVIHNNEGYGVVLVRPVMPSEVKDATAQTTKGNTQPTQSGHVTACGEGTGQEQQPECGTEELELYERAEIAGQTEGNYEIANELGATSAKKSKRHKKRLSELGITEADDNLMSQDMFISVEVCLVLMGMQDTEGETGHAEKE